MSKFFKKAFKIFHPVEAKMFGIGGKKDDGGQGFMNLGSSKAHQQDLDSAMADYQNIPTAIRDQYTAASKKAGTFANTNEFNSGLNSEVNAGVRGARVNAVARINAIKKSLGQAEDFKPEGYDQTQANATQDNLANNPAKDVEPTPAPAAEEANPQAPVANAAAAVQNAPKKSLLNARPAQAGGPTGVMGMGKAKQGPVNGRVGALRRML